MVTVESKSIPSPMRCPAFMSHVLGLSWVSVYSNSQTSGLASGRFAGLWSELATLSRSVMREIYDERVFGTRLYRCARTRPGRDHRAGLLSRRASSGSTISATPRRKTVSERLLHNMQPQNKSQAQGPRYGEPRIGRVSRRLSLDKGFEQFVPSSWRLL